MAFLSSLNQSRVVEMIYPVPEHEAEAKRILQQYDDQDFSLADAISFVVMQHQGIAEVFTYDSHFATMGFNLLSERS